MSALRDTCLGLVDMQISLKGAILLEISPFHNGKQLICFSGVY